LRKKRVIGHRLRQAAIDGMLAFALEERLWVELASGALVPAMIATAEMLPKHAVSAWSSVEETYRCRT